MKYIQHKDDNTFPDCKKCGRCCQTNILAITQDELSKMHQFVNENGIIARNYDKKRCCFQNNDSTCAIWEVRPQICRLHNCQIPRMKIIEDHPEIQIPETIPLVDMHYEFTNTTDKDASALIIVVE